jgi:hypothetical protein
MLSYHAVVTMRKPLRANARFGRTMDVSHQLYIGRLEGADFQHYLRP